MQTPQLRLIGHPLGHSISPQIHQRLFELSGKTGNYSCLEIAPEALESAIPSLRELSGFNVTIPYKQSVIPFLDGLEGGAQRYGSVNTVKNDNGQLIGYNTDAEGFLSALQSAGIELHGNILLCGAGGVSHMMAYEALDRGCTLTVATPTISEARSFCYELSDKYPNAQISPSTLLYTSGSFDLILNGTPCGMYPDSNGCPLPNNVIRAASAIFDAIYNPCKTVMLQKAAKAGAKTLGGLQMLVRQAAAAQKIWFGTEFTEDQLNGLCSEMEQFIQENFAS